MFRFLTAREKETVEQTRELFQPRGVRFTLVGGAACREYGLTRSVKDLDFVVDPYGVAIHALSHSSEFAEYGEADPTQRTCTMRSIQTGVLVDFLTGGIRITDKALLGYVVYSDLLPIPQPSGFGDLIPLGMLVEMKLGAILSGLDTCALGATDGDRTEQELRQDVEDISSLISLQRLHRDIPFSESEIKRIYQNIFDGIFPVSKFIGDGQVL